MAKSHLNISIKVPLPSDSMFDQAETLARLKPHIDALREAMPAGHTYSDKIAKERDESKPRKPRTPRAPHLAA